MGEFDVLDIGLSKVYLDEVSAGYHYFDQKDAAQILKPRFKFTHKGSFGHAQLIGGSYGKIGAIRIAGEAALKAGVGLLSISAPKCGLTPLQAGLPEAMVDVCASKKHLSFIKKLDNTTLGIGPGLGTHRDSADGLIRFLKNQKEPLVLDADALNILSAAKAWNLVPKGSILTPHPGEFARMIKSKMEGLECVESLLRFAKQYELVVVLKGAHTMVSDGREVSFNSTGNPGMATAGSGDALTGVITSFLAQNYLPYDAARLGVYVHGLAGDIAAAKIGEHSLIASDITDHFSAAIQSLI